jgi:hypothetical protein
MRAVDKIKDSVESSVVAPVLSELDRFNESCKSFGGSTQVEGLRLYNAFNSLIMGSQKFKELSLLTTDVNLMDHIRDGWELDIFEDPCFDEDWYLELFMRFDSDAVVHFFCDWDKDGAYLYDLMDYWCCDEVGKLAIDMYSHEELDFAKCRDVVQRCRIAGNLNLKVWLDKLDETMLVMGDTLPESWWKAYGYQE